MTSVQGKIVNCVKNCSYVNTTGGSDDKSASFALSRATAVFAGIFFVPDDTVRVGVGY